MSKVIQIRGVPDDVHAELTRRAEAAGLSLSRFVLRELELTSRLGRNAEIFARLRELPATSITDEEIIEDIRAERDRAG
jgi:antitoxin FitA